MKKKVLLIIIISLSTLATYSNNHRFGLKVEGGYDDVLISLPNKGHFGTKTDIGIVYELQDKHFLLQVGVGVNHMSNVVHNDLHSGFFENMIDTDNDACTYHYVLEDKTDKINHLNVSPRVSLGGNWELFYFLLGSYINISMLDVTRSRCYLTTSGEYENLIDPLKDMPNHFFFNRFELSNIYKQSDLYNKKVPKPDIRIHAEFGIKLPMRNAYGGMVSAPRLTHRIALSLEVGVVDVSPTKMLQLCDFQKSSDKIEDINFDNIKIHHLYHSNLSATKLPYSIGIVYTLLLQYSQRNKCNCTE